MPLSFTPPNGPTSVETRPVLAPTMPYSSASETRQIRPTSRVVEVGREPEFGVVRKRDRLGFVAKTEQRRDRDRRSLRARSPFRRVALRDHRRLEEAAAERVARTPPVTSDAPFASASAMWLSTLSTAAEVDERTLLDAIFAARGRPRADRSRPRRASSQTHRRSPSCTRKRFAQTQVWPAYSGTCSASHLRPRRRRSASSKTMKGALPPSSSDTFFTVPAHCSISSLPTSVDPVKLSLRTVGVGS